tara:strand:- start:1909 stop:2214 length:306 start_codon:yes stop_codon:yes gene_type:complete
MYYAVYDARDGCVWGAGRTMDIAWENAKKELQEYIHFMCAYNQDPQIGFEDLRMHFFLNECNDEVWENYVTSNFPLHHKAKIDEGVLMPDGVLSPTEDPPS